MCRMLIWGRGARPYKMDEKPLKFVKNPGNWVPVKERDCKTMHVDLVPTVAYRLFYLPIPHPLPNLVL